MELWAFQMSHASHGVSSLQCRIVLADNFYRRHNLSVQVNVSSDGVVRSLGTVRITNMDSLNCKNLKSTQDSLKEKPHGAWVLYKAYR